MKDTVNIHGKQYETVASRVARFRQEFKTAFSIETELVSADEKTVVMKAVIRSIPKGATTSMMDQEHIIATGYAEESRTSSQINRTSALENAETSAIGRALAAFGMAGTEYASADEVAQAITQQNAPQRPVQAPQPAARPAVGTQPAGKVTNGQATLMTVKAQRKWDIKDKVQALDDFLTTYGKMPADVETGEEFNTIMEDLNTTN